MLPYAVKHTSYRDTVVKELC